VAGLTTLCLSNQRFKVEVQWKDFQGNTGSGQSAPLTSDTGTFWFFNAANVELVVKVLDARAINGHFWVFYGALSNVEYTLTVTDTANGQLKAYANPSGTFGSVGDTNAFPTSTGGVSSSHTERSGAMFNLGGKFEFPAAASGMESERAPSAADCSVQATSLSLSGCRFRVSVTWKDFQGNTGSGQAVALTADTGYFWFFNAANVELVAKVLDARAINGNFWVFYGALSNVEYEITVTDTTTAVSKRYLNPAQHFGSTGDTGAFPPAPAPAASSEELIDLDLKAGKITDEQALVYLVYAAYGSPSLPAKYRSTAEPGIDLPIAKTVAKRFPTLSPAAQAAIQPYLVPPIYKGSWGDPDFVASIQSGQVRVDSARKAPGGAAAACNFGTQPGQLPGWGHKLTEHFNIWYRTAIPPHYTYTTADAETAATNVAAVAEAVWTSLTGLFHTVPLSDVNEGCNGGDGALDVYIDRLGFGALAQTSAYLPGCAARPTWMWMGPDRISDPVTARDVFAHEFMHMIGFSYTRGGDCDEYDWLDEAAGNWAIDYVYPKDQFEQIGPNQSYAPCYYAIDYGLPIEKSAIYGCNGYSDYVFLFYLSHKLGPQTIKSIYENAELFDAFDSLDNATAGAGGLKKVWPDFVTAGFNDWQDGVADDFYKWDELQEGHEKVSNERDSEITPIDMKGLSEKTFDLTEDFFVAGSDGSHTIEPLAARYVYLKFPDESARYVVFHNKPAEIASLHPHLHVRALMKINGKWQPEEDWTNDLFKTFCRDAKAERIEELAVIYSNSNPARPGFDSNGKDSSRIYLDEDNGMSHVPEIQISNIGCWSWTGTASVTTRSVSGPTMVESATATFTRYRLPDTGPDSYVGFDMFKSTNTGTATYSISGPLTGTSCTISGTGSGSLQGDGGFIADAGFVATFLMPGQVTNRTAIGSGRTNIAVTKTITCPPTPPETSTGPEDVHWFSLPEQGGASFGADGRVLSGQQDWTDSDGAKHAVWVLRSQREE